MPPLKGRGRVTAVGSPPNTLGEGEGTALFYGALMKGRGITTVGSPPDNPCEGHISPSLPKEGGGAAMSSP